MMVTFLIPIPSQSSQNTQLLKSAMMSKGGERKKRPYFVDTTLQFSQGNIIIYLTLMCLTN